MERDSIRVKKRPGANHGGQEYTPEELLVLASLRRSSGRTCRSCSWFQHRGAQRGCFPEGKYRKWLSPEEYQSGCDRYARKERE